MAMTNHIADFLHGSVSDQYYPSKYQVKFI